jgi:hypothetical protein
MEDVFSFDKRLKTFEKEDGVILSRLENLSQELKIERKLSPAFENKEEITVSSCLELIKTASPTAEIFKLTEIDTRKMLERRGKQQVEK